MTYVSVTINLFTSISIKLKSSAKLSRPLISLQFFWYYCFWLPSNIYVCDDDDEGRQTYHNIVVHKNARS